MILYYTYSIFLVTIILTFPKKLNLTPLKDVDARLAPNIKYIYTRNLSQALTA
jgi:hypothetical protein